MNKATNQEDIEDITLTPQELHALSELDSRQFGFLLLHLPENFKKRTLVIKAVKYLQYMVVQANRQCQSKEGDTETDKNENTTKPISIDPKTWVKLGHFHLLLEEYDKALSAYQKFFKLHKDDHWTDPTFLYGLGLVYFYFNAFLWYRYPKVNLNLGGILLWQHLFGGKQVAYLVNYSNVLLFELFTTKNSRFSYR